MDVIEKELVELTAKLIKYKTITHNNSEINSCFEFIKNYMKGFYIEEIEKNGTKILVISDKKKRKYDYILLGHIDVVPAENKMFVPKITKEKIWGRGSYDMKSGVAIAMLLMKNLILKNTALILTSDEEDVNSNKTAYLANKYKSNCVISMESTDEYILNKRKGALWITLESKGKSCHSSLPWKGKNAGENVINSYNEIKKIFPRITEKSSKEVKWQPTCNLGYIKSGNFAYNVSPDFAEMGLDIRFTEKEDIDKLIDKIKKIANKHKCIIRNYIMNHNIYTSPKNKDIIKLAKIGNLKLRRGYGSSDTCYFNVKGIPVLEFGPKGFGHHTKNEAVYIKSMLKVYKILKKFFEKNQK